MHISEFARRAGLSTDTVRFYVRKRLLTPEISLKGGSIPYQIFTNAHVETVRLIRAAQALGFSLKEIADIAMTYHTRTLTPKDRTEVIRAQIEKIETKAALMDAMITYMRAKLDWIESGGQGPEPKLAQNISLMASPKAVSSAS